MDSETFFAIIANRLEACQATMAVKSDEYTTTKDRLHNFKTVGRARGIDPVEALDGMMMKHVASMWDLMDKMAENPDFVPELGVVSEKLGDVINYVLLFEALIEERRYIRAGVRVD